MTAPALQGTTTGGLPYPETTNPLQQGANDIKALALALDPRAPKKVMLVNTSMTTDAAGEIRITVPGTQATVGIIMYTGAYPPIMGNVTLISGPTVTVRLNRGTDGSAVLSSVVGVMGVIYYT